MLFKWEKLVLVELINIFKEIFVEWNSICLENNLFFAGNIFYVWTLFLLWNTNKHTRLCCFLIYWKKFLQIFLQIRDFFRFAIVKIFLSAAARFHAISKIKARGTCKVLKLSLKTSWTHERLANVFSWESLSVRWNCTVSRYRTDVVKTVSSDFIIRLCSLSFHPVRSVSDYTGLHKGKLFRFLKKFRRLFYFSFSQIFFFFFFAANINIETPDSISGYWKL